MIILFRRLTVWHLILRGEVMNEEFDIEKLILKFRQAIYLHKSHLRKSATENGLYDGQLPILEYIIKHDGCTQTDIAKFRHHQNVCTIRYMLTTSHHRQVHEHRKFLYS